MSIPITSFTGNNENFLCGKRVIRKISNAGSRASSGPYHGLELPIHGISLSATRHVDISGSEAKTHPRSSSVFRKWFFVCSSSEPSKNLLVLMSSKNFVMGDSGTGLFITKPLPGSMLTDCQVNPLAQTSAKFEHKTQAFDSIKCRLETEGHFFSGLIKHSVNKPHGKANRPDFCLNNGMVLMFCTACIPPTSLARAQHPAKVWNGMKIITLKYVDVMMTSFLHPMSTGWRRQLWSLMFKTGPFNVSVLFLRSAQQRQSYDYFARACKLWGVYH